MASIDDVISLAITKSTATATRTSFGNGLILADGPTWSERVRSYTKLSAVLTDFPAAAGVNHPVYDAASAFFSQSPRPKRFKVGRRANHYTQVYTLTVLTPATVDGTKTAITVEGATYEVTAGAAETTTTIATALAAAIDPNANVTATSALAVVTVTAVSASKVLRISGFDTSKLQVKNTTPDPGIVADFTAVAAEDNDFYDVGLDSQSHAEVAALAATIATLPKELWFSTMDTLCEVTGSADIFSVLKAAAYDNVIGFYDKQDSRNYRAFRAMAKASVKAPGSYTLKFKKLKGDIGADTLTDTADGFVKSKNGNRYIDVGAGAQLMEGVAASGEFEDATRFLAWVTQEVKLRLLDFVSGADKVPLTNPGIAGLEAQIRSVMDDGIRVGGIAPEREGEDTPYDVSAPDVLDIPDADRALRNVPDLAFAFRLAGAVHSANVEGTVSV